MYSDNSSIMRNRIQLQSRIFNKNEYGEAIETWEDGPILASSFEALRGSEFFRRGDLPQHIAEIDARIRIRFRRGLNPADNRVVYAGVVYDIQAILPDRSRNQMQLMVKARATGQPDGSKVNG